jgi:hypothetical protein
MIDIAKALAALHRGGAIACPAEGVWGLGCDSRGEAAVPRLLALKQRDAAKGVDPGRVGQGAAGALHRHRIACRGATGRGARRLAGAEYPDRAGLERRTALDHRRA